MKPGEFAWVRDVNGLWHRAILTCLRTKDSEADTVCGRYRVYIDRMAWPAVDDTQVRVCLACEAHATRVREWATYDGINHKIEIKDGRFTYTRSDRKSPVFVLPSTADLPGDWHLAKLSDAALGVLVELLTATVVATMSRPPIRRDVK